MARGHRRTTANRHHPISADRRKTASTAAGARPAHVRTLAVNALALTGAAITVLNPARAVTLGEAVVESRLGQPLAARVPLELAAGEMIGAACVRVPAGTSPDLAALPAPVVSVPEGNGPGAFELRVTTAQPLYEPMYELQLQVRCPGTALVVRQYVLMLDLPATGASAAAPAAAQATVVSAGPAAGTPVAAPATTAPATAGTPRSRPERVLERPAAPIVAGTRYRVGAGDTLSTIAARVGGTGESIWARADRIFAANPDAFIGGNPDLIKLGSEIVIPAAGSAATPVAAAPAAAPTAAEPPVAPPMAETPAAPPEASAAPVAAAPDVAADPLAGAASQAPADAVADPFDATTADGTSGQASVEAVFQDEQQVPAEPLAGAGPGADGEAAVDAVPVAAAPAQPAEASPWLAALLGILVGALVSAGLLRDRLLEALRSLRTVRHAAGAPVPVAAAAAAIVAPVARQSAPSESTMVVVEGHLDEDTDQLLAQAVERSGERRAPAVAQADRRAALGGDPATDLSRLFEDVPAAAPVADDLVAGLPVETELDLDLSAATPDVTIDQEIAWLGDDTALTPTQEAGPLGGSGGDTVEQLDLQTLSGRATSDQQVSQTLQEALNLLESDYEDELTASQVIDKKKLREFLDDDSGEDTLVRTGTDQIPRR